MRPSVFMWYITAHRRLDPFLTRLIRGARTFLLIGGRTWAAVETDGNIGLVSTWRGVQVIFGPARLWMGTCEGFRVKPFACTLEVRAPATSRRCKPSTRVG